MTDEKINNVEKIIESATGKLKEINGGQVTGKIIVNEKGQKAVAVSDMTVAVFCGGGEYGSAKTNLKNGENFAGGCAVICSLKPDNFILDNGEGFQIVKAENPFTSLAEISELFLKAFKK